MAEEKDIQEEVKEKKSFMKFIILGVVVLFLGAGGFFAWNLVLKEKVAAKGTSETESQQIKEEEKEIYPLKSFVVNLMDKTGLGKRYLKATVELEVSKQEEIKKMLDNQKPQLRDTILLMLSSQAFNEVNTMEGKIALKQALLFRINQVLGKQIVHKVYFTEFVVQ